VVHRVDAVRSHDEKGQVAMADEKDLLAGLCTEIDALEERRSE
jgi:hypothetical protein